MPTAILYASIGRRIAQPILRSGKTLIMATGQIFTLDRPKIKSGATFTDCTTKKRLKYLLCNERVKIIVRQTAHSLENFDHVTTAENIYPDLLVVVYWIFTP